MRNKAYIPIIHKQRRKPMLQIFAQALLLTVSRPMPTDSRKHVRG